VQNNSNNNDLPLNSNHLMNISNNISNHRKRVSYKLSLKEYIGLNNFLFRHQVAANVYYLVLHH
jgi:hypothetical protein